MRKLKYLWLLLPLILSGCTTGGGGIGDFPIDQLVKNPLIQIIIGVIVLWIVFRSANKH